jgi:opacity protein-like surface antigen
MKRLLTVAAVLLTVGAVSSAQLALRGVGGAVGFVSVSFTSGSTESLSGFLLAAHADLGEVAKDITIFPDIEYFSTSKSVSGYDWKVSDFAINVNGHYNIQMEGQLKPYVGAGLGINFLSSTVNLPSYSFLGVTYGGEQTESATRLGINLLAGVNYKLNDQLTLLVEPRYVLASDFNHFLIKAGVTYAMK